MELDVSMKKLEKSGATALQQGPVRRANARVVVHLTGASERPTSIMAPRHWSILNFANSGSGGQDGSWILKKPHGSVEVRFAGCRCNHFGRARG
jgi:hypothetical protein